MNRWIAIVALLALLTTAVAATGFFVARAGSRGSHRERQDRKCAATAGQVAKMVKRYHEVHGHYPKASGRAFLDALLVQDVMSEPRLLQCSLTDADGGVVRYLGRRNTDPKHSIASALKNGATPAQIAVVCDPVTRHPDGSLTSPHGDTFYVAFLDGHVDRIPLDSPRTATILQQLGE